MWFHLCLCGFVCSSVSLFLCFCASFLQLATPQTTCSLCGRRETRCKWTPSLCHSLISDKKISIMGTAPNSMKEQVLYLSWGNLFLVLFFPRKLKCSLVRKVVLLKCSTSQKHPGLPFKPGTTHSTETHHFFFFFTFLPAPPSTFKVLKLTVTRFWLQCCSSQNFSFIHSFIILSETRIFCSGFRLKAILSLDPRIVLPGF